MLKNHPLSGMLSRWSGLLTFYRGLKIPHVLLEKSRVIPVSVWSVKVTVQLETEGNGQNEIVSHMYRSEVKL